MSLWKCVTQMCIFSGLSFFPVLQEAGVKEKIDMMFDGKHVLPIWDSLLETFGAILFHISH